MLIAQNILLREVQPTDVNIIYQWENNPENWEVSNTKDPFTKEEIEDFVSSCQHVYTTQQMRFIICLRESEIPIGCIDLFEYDDQFNRVGLGILIANKKYRRKGYAKEALSTLITYCKDQLKINHFFCNIFKENTMSIRLFESCGFNFEEERLLAGKKVNYYHLSLNY